MLRLGALGLRGVEVAPTRLAPWPELTPARIRAHRQALAEVGLIVPSLQAILFGAEGVALLGDVAAYARLLEHLRHVAAVASEYGARIAVLGAPRQRARGAMAEADAFALGAERLRGCAEACMAEAGLVLALEPVPTHYGSDFLLGAAEAEAMVRQVAHPGLRLHLDTGCALLGGDNIGTAITAGADVLAHMHIAEPDLAGFLSPRAAHTEAAAALQVAGYSRWRSIEMRQAPDWRAACEAALRFATRVYQAGVSTAAEPLAS